MKTKTMILGAAAACAAAMTFTATAASADPWWARSYAPTSYEYRHAYSYPDGRTVGSLVQREDYLADHIRRLSQVGRLNPWEADRAWRGLNEARQMTSWKSRQYGPYLPPGEYYRIASRLDGVWSFLLHEANDRD